MERIDIDVFGVLKLEEEAVGNKFQQRNFPILRLPVIKKKYIKEIKKEDRIEKGK